MAGVFQRCADACPETGCKIGHKWAYEIELPAVAGKRCRLRGGGYATGALAAAARAEAVVRARKNLRSRGHEYTVEQWLLEWLRIQQDLRGLRDGTLIDYARHVRSYWIPSIGHYRLEELRPHHVSDTLATIQRERDEARRGAIEANTIAMAVAAEADTRRVARGLKRPVKPTLAPVPRPFGPSTAKLVHATLRAALNAAVRAEELTHNVAAQAPHPTCRRKRVTPWTPRQLGAWLDSVYADRLYPLFHLAAFNGLRRGELVGLRWEDVDFEKGRIAVRLQITSISYRKARRAVKAGERPMYLTRVKTEQGQGNLVDLDQASLKLLLRVRSQQDREVLTCGVDRNTDGLVFTRPNGEPYNPQEVYRRFQESVDAAGFERVPLHMMRHVAASLLIEAGVDIAVISKRLGRSKISLTADTYGHLIGDVSKRAVEAAAQLVPRKVGDWCELPAGCASMRAEAGQTRPFA